MAVANSMDYPQPKKGCVYKHQYLQGDARADREAMRRDSFQVASRLLLQEKNACSYMLDDAFGIIMTGARKRLWEGAE